MIPAKNHEAVSKFVKVMPRILWPLFFRTRCTCSLFRTEIFQKLTCTSNVKYFLRFLIIITRNGSLMPSVFIASAGHVMYVVLQQTTASNTDLFSSEYVRVLGHEMKFLVCTLNYKGCPIKFNSTTYMYSAQA